MNLNFRTANYTIILGSINWDGENIFFNETDENIRKYEKEKKKANAIDQMLYDLQIPLLVSVLFFFFQMPMINTMFYKNFSFLSVYNADGNINFYGILLKSILFGSIFYSLQKTVNFLTDF
jgi:hypothetical protein